MSLFKTQSAAIYGIDARLIDVEVDMYASGSARDSRMVGMPDVAVRESRERIKSAMINGLLASHANTGTGCAASAARARRSVDGRLRRARRAFPI
ncbi:MAG: hypothetical protein LAP87_24425 [Acidobacteriia bacterium]|nr:hypothetical protein [Terriglobia bacterium]